ncbi:MAG: vWA domain-containing protein [Candidatus Uhrbacteria bacterium]
MRAQTKVLYWALALGLAFVGAVANAVVKDTGGQVGVESAPSATASAQAHDCVVVVLDASGSMGDSMGSIGGQSKIDAAKSALKTVLAAVPQTTYVGLLVFSSSGTNGWVQELGPRDDQRLNAAIDAIRANSGTPLAQHIKMGADRLLQERERQLGYGSYRLLVVTDGEETEDKHAIEAYPPLVRQRGIALDVIGVKMEGEHTLAKYANSYRRANDPASLTRAVREVLAEVSAKDVGSATGEDAFAALEGLDPEIAAAMVKALDRTGNLPIGTTTVAAPPPRSPQPTTVPWPTGSAPPPGTTAPPSGCNCATTGSLADTTAVIVVAFALVARRSRHRSFKQ